MYPGAGFAPRIDQVGYNRPNEAKVRPMAKKNAESKSDRKEESCANVLDKLDSAEAASVLGKLLDRLNDLRSEAEAIASDMLTEISPDSVADEIEEALLQFDYDDLNGRAGEMTLILILPLPGYHIHGIKASQSRSNGSVIARPDTDPPIGIRERA